MKKAYEKPLVEIVEFEPEDTLMTASSLTHQTNGFDDDIMMILWGDIK